MDKKKPSKDGAGSRSAVRAAAEYGSNKNEHGPEDGSVARGRGRKQDAAGPPKSAEGKEGVGSESIATKPKKEPAGTAGPPKAARPSALIDTRVIYCGDNLEQLQRLPEHCVDLIYIDPPFNSNRNYEVFWGETKEKRAFEDRHASTQAYIDYMRPRCVELARVLKPTGSFYYHCDWHAILN